MGPIRTVLVTGGGGYVGARLVPRLLGEGYRVKVLDLFLFGEEVLAPAARHPSLEIVRGDIRDARAVRRAVSGADAVIHLACISNDPSFELDPELGHSINFDAFEPLVRSAKDAGVGRFVYASSSSVYGVSASPEVNEDHPHAPLTDYSRLKSRCEPILLEARSSSFDPVVIRPATLCGWSPRLRLDLTVNLLTNHAVNRGKITVFGGNQMRPNLHIEDMVDLYCLLLRLPAERISGRVYNAGHQNRTVADLAALVRSLVEERVPGRERVELVTTPSDDQRSYHISSERIGRDLGFFPRRSVEDAVIDLIAAFRAGTVPGALDDPRYYNLQTLRGCIGELLHRSPADVPFLAEAR